MVAGTLAAGGTGIDEDDLDSAFTLRTATTNSAFSATSTSTPLHHSLGDLSMPVSPEPNRQLSFPENKVYGREKELARLNAAYRRLVSSNGEASLFNNNVQICILEGYSGVGKSTLVNEFVRRLNDDDQEERRVVLASGKYHECLMGAGISSTLGRVHDQGGDATTSLCYQSSAVPYSGISQALTSMVEQCMKRTGAIDNSKSVPPTSIGGKATASIGITDAEELTEDNILNIDDIRLLTDIAPHIATFLEQLHHVSLPSQQSRNHTFPTKDDGSVHTIETALMSNQRSSQSRYLLGRRPVDNSRIATAVASLIRVLFKSPPASRMTLALFLDDLQWMDAASFEMLQALWKDPTLPKWMFIGSARISHGSKAYPVIQKIRDSFCVQKGNAKIIEHILVDTLHPAQLSRFVADTLDKKDIHEVEPLSEFLYSKSLGNIFLCRQIMDALVRNGTIYFGYVSWQFRLSGLIEDAQNLAMDNNANVVQMIQDKVTHLKCAELRSAVIVASYIRPMIDNEVLLACLASVTSSLPDLNLVQFSEEKLPKVLDLGVECGLLMTTAAGLSSEVQYKFSHDKVVEAAIDLIPAGPQRERLRSCIGCALLDLLGDPLGSEALQESTIDISVMGSMPNSAVQLPPKQKEWMVFAAVDHLKDASADNFPCDHMKFMCASFQVGLLCLSKASFDQAVQHFRTLSFLIMKDPKTYWRDHYQFCLETFTHLLETEFALGNFEESSTAIAIVLERATSLLDKVDAHHTMICTRIKSNNDVQYAIGVKELSRLLRNEYCQVFPESPSKADIMKERLQFKVALGTRSLSYIANLPHVKDDRGLKLLAELVSISNMAGKSSLHSIACLRFMRLSLQQGISKYLPLIMTEYATSVRREGNYQVAYSFAAVVETLYARFPEERSPEYAMSRMILHSGILHLVEPFVESMDALLLNYRLAMAAGGVDIAFMSAMHFPWIYFATGLPMNASLASKIDIFERKARDFGRHGFVAIFRLCRQFKERFHHNLMTSTSDENRIETEEEICTNLEGNSLKMTLRDSAILRSMAAFVMGDENEMRAMSQRLDEYPLFDLPLVRQHLRLTFHGMSCLLLGRKQGNNVFTRKGKTLSKELKTLDSIGSFNAHASYYCLRAVEVNRPKAYKRAITACAESRFLHLEAMMNEHCALYYLEAAKSSTKSTVERNRLHSKAEDCMQNALWLYRDWGADAKAHQIRSTFDFVNNSETAHSFTMSPQRSSWGDRENHLRDVPLVVATAICRPSDGLLTEGAARGASSLDPPSMPRRSASPPPLCL